ncbi:MAG TPA: hypothetical protein DEP38_15280 [Cyanobacteria bacterium UBA9226]|nr:hypothetical protein [Cyanobacteria bacterium UBA9226]
MATKTGGCATCTDLSSLTRTVNQIRDGQVAQIREMGIITGQNRIIIGELAAIQGKLAGIAAAVGVGVVGDKLGKILNIVSALASVISAGFSVYAGLSKGELKKLLIETKKKANDAQYAATQASIKADKLLEQSLFAEAESIIRDSEIRKLSNDSLYAATQASIKSDKLNENIIQLSKNQNENLTIISNDIVQISDNLNRNLQAIFDKQITPSIIREIKPSISEIMNQESPRIIEKVIQREIPKIIKEESPNIAKEVAKSPQFEPVVKVAPELRGFMREVVPPEVKKEGDFPNWIKKWFVEKYAPSITWKPSELERYNQKIRKEIIEGEKRRTSTNYISDQIKDIAGKITPLPALIAGLNPAKNPEVFNKISEAAASGVCKSTLPGGCMGRALNNLGDRNAQGLNNLGSKLDAANLAANTAQLTLLKKIDTTTVTNGVKLGNQLPNGGIGGKLSRIGDMLKLPQILSVANFAVSVHNALMLSRSIGDTLGSVIDTAIRLIVPKDSELAGINVSQILGREFRELLINIVGVENYTQLSVNFAKANRIYQAGSNLIWSVQSITDNSLMVGNAIFENVSLIGNALKKARTINDNAFDWMSPNMSAQFRWQKRLENMDEAAGFLLLIASGLLGVKESIEETKENKKELDKAIADARKPVTEKQEKEVIASLVSDGILDESWDVGEAE